MKTIGFLISRKEYENRRALIPLDLKEIIHTDKLFFEIGYGNVLGYSDEDYLHMGANVVPVNEIYQQDIICNPKSPEPEEYKYFNMNQVLFGWIHAVQGKTITDFLINKNMTAVAWEDLYVGDRHVFWRNNEIAGEAGVLHAFLYFGRLPSECSVAVLGKGNTARGAIRVLENMGCNVVVYDKKTIASLRDNLHSYDVIVNCVLWDVFRTDKLIYRVDLKKMKFGSMIVDITCNNGLEIETTHQTTIANPIFYVDNILHYAVDHTATLFYKSASESISAEIKKYVDDLVEENENEVLSKGTIIKNGKIIDKNIIRYQERS